MREQRIDNAHVVVHGITANPKKKARVGCVAVNTNRGEIIIDRVAQKHDAAGKKLRPFQRVYHGNAYRTVGGLLQQDLMRWKGRIVSKKAHAAGMKRFREMPRAEKKEFLGNAVTPTRKSVRARTTPKRYGFGGSPGGPYGDDGPYGNDSDGGDSDAGADDM